MELSQKQLMSFQQADAPFCIWIGAVRSGKTFSSIFKLIDLLKNGPPGDCMLIGVTRDSIQRNILTELFRFLGFGLPPSKTTETKLYGRNVYFVGASDESAVRRIQGSTLAFAYIDEATCIPAPFWRMLISRLSVPKSQLLATCNPEGPAHWLKKEYIDRAEVLKLKYWNFTLDDNPSLDKEYKERIKASYTGMWYKRYVLGQWAAAHGLVYDTYDFNNEYEHPFCNPLYYIVGVDYGTTNATAAVLVGVRPNQWPQLTVEEEYYYDSAVKGRSKADDELAQDIKEFVGHRNVRAIYVDPAAASLKVAMQQIDLPVIDAKNDVLPGIKTVGRFISNKNIVIQKGCRTLIDHIQSYAWDPKAADRGEDKPLKVQDHIVDALRYCVHSAFPRGEFSHPDENLSIEQLRRKVYGGEEMLGIHQGYGGYF
jgi:PBSX family phage terminase large subunit